MRLFRGDAALRVASVMLAAALWFVIAGKQTAERGLAVPVELRNVPRDLELTGDAVNTVDVRLRASPGLINSLDSGKVLAAIDLAGAKEGEKIVQLAPGMIQVPHGYRVVKITPSLLTLNLEGTERKSIPVRPRVIGRPAPGYEVVAVSSDPPEVRVAGPRSRVQEIESAFTEPLSVEGASSLVAEPRAVGLEDPLLRLEGGSRVSVTAVVREVEETRRFEALPVVARGRAARLTPARVTVAVAGPASHVRVLQPSDVLPHVSVPPDLAGPVRLPVAVDLPPGREGLRFVESRPAEVSARPLPEKRSP